MAGRATTTTFLRSNINIDLAPISSFSTVENRERFPLRRKKSLSNATNQEIPSNITVAKEETFQR